jgi:hypothetical protein
MFDRERRIHHQCAYAMNVLDMLLFHKLLHEDICSDCGSGRGRSRPNSRHMPPAVDGGDCPADDGVERGQSNNSHGENQATWLRPYTNPIPVATLFIV